jgi:hypothetical protein
MDFSSPTVDTLSHRSYCVNVAHRPPRVRPCAANHGARRLARLEYPLLQEDIPLSEAALRCGLTWPAAYKRLLRGEFGPARQVAGRWLVASEGVERYLARTAHEPSR